MNDATHQIHMLAPTYAMLHKGAFLSTRYQQRHKNLENYTISIMQAKHTHTLSKHMHTNSHSLEVNIMHRIKYTSIVCVKSESVCHLHRQKTLLLIYAHNAPYTFNHFVCAIYVDKSVDNLELCHRGYFQNQF